MRILSPVLFLALLAGCAGVGVPVEPPVPGARLVHVRHDRADRTYWYYAGGEQAPRPLLVVLHGSGDDGAAMIKLGRFAALADEQHLILVAPNARGSSFVAEDVGFLTKIIREIRKREAVTSVFVAGFDSGGTMAQRLGAQAGSELDGIAAVAAKPTTDIASSVDAEAAPLPVLLVFGGDDPLKAESGPAIGFWVDRFGCGTKISATVRILHQSSWYGCAGNVPVVLAMVDGFGHEWPDRHFVTTEVIWDFFSKRIRRSTTSESR